MEWTKINDSYPPLDEVVIMAVDDKTMPGIYLFGNESIITTSIRDNKWTCWKKVDLPNN